MENTQQKPGGDSGADNGNGHPNGHRGNGRGRDRFAGLSKEERDAQIIARNQERARNPMSLLLVPRTFEGMLLCRMLNTLDRTVHRLRMQAGSTIPLEKAASWLTKVDDLQASFKTTLGEFGIQSVGLLTGIDGQEPPAVRESLAARRNAHVFLPRCEAVRQLIHSTQQLDSALMTARLVSTDLTKVAAAVASATSLVKQTHYLTEALANITEIEYTPPKRYAQLVPGAAQ